jgi:small subunit ribosomal protein MRP21
MAALLGRRLTPSLTTPASLIARRTMADSTSRPGGAAQPARKDTGSAIDNLFRDESSPSDAPPTAPARARNSRVFGADFSAPPSRTRSRKPPGLNFDDMVMPDSLSGGGAVTPSPRDAANALAAQQENTFESYPRLNPTYGRTVDLAPARGRDIVRGIGMLASLMARNKVKHDFNKQRFHERNGLKRKRLNSERWRARFKVGFKHVTARVTELTRKGW